MNYNIVELDDIQVEDIEGRLEDYDKKHIKYSISGNIRIGISYDDKLIAGADASMTAFKILYVSTVFVDKEYRNKKIGTLLMNEVERRSKMIGANMIRLDTFDWQGKIFILHLDMNK